MSKQKFQKTATTIILPDTISLLILIYKLREKTRKWELGCSYPDCRRPRSSLPGRHHLKTSSSKPQPHPPFSLLSPCFSLSHVLLQWADMREIQKPGCVAWPLHPPFAIFLICIIGQSVQFSHWDHSRCIITHELDAVLLLIRGR